MDFHSLKRRDLQSLCKRNNIPANLTNAAMADSLFALPTVEGVEEFLGQTMGSESPERSVITDSPAVPRSSTCRSKQQPAIEEGSKMATSSRYGTRRRAAAAEGTETRKTPATRTTRRVAVKDAVSVQKKAEKEMQAQFEADLELSDVTEISEEVSGVSVEKAPEISNDEQEVTGLESDKENLNAVNEAQEDDLVEEIKDCQKIDFHSLCRKDLQALCKKNKIPANITSAAMADNLASLETVEGLEEFLRDYDPLAIKSPGTSRMTSARARQTQTCRKTTQQKSGRACSALSQNLSEKMEPFSIADKELPVSECLENSDPLDIVTADCSAFSGESMSVLEEASAETEIVALTDARKAGNEGIGSEVADVCDRSTGSLNVELNMSAAAILRDENILLEAVDDTLETTVVQQEIKAISPEKSWEYNASEDLNDQQEVDKVVESDEASESNAVFSDEETDEQDVSDQQEFEVGKTVENDMASESDAVSSDEETDDGNVSGEESDSENVDSDDKTAESDGESDVSSFDFSNDVSDAENLKHIEINDVAVEDVSFEEDTYTAGEVHSSVSSELEQVAICVTEDEAYSNSAEEVSSMCENFERETSQPEVEKVDAGVAEDSFRVVRFEEDTRTETQQVNDEFDTVSEIEAGQHAAPKVEETPLCHKSLRKLKRMLKEKLQEANGLAKNINKLTLEDNEISHGSETSDVVLGKEAGEKIELGSDALPMSAASGVDETENDMINSGNLSSIHILQDNEISEDSVIGQISVHSLDSEKSVENATPVGMTDSENILQFSPIKSSRKTPTKPVLTPKSSIRTPLTTNRILDVNKENIDSANKTEPGKINMVVAGSGKLFSALSMGKLKKEFKSLQQSDKKRTALQSRSENQVPLASP